MFSGNENVFLETRNKHLYQEKLSYETGKITWKKSAVKVVPFRKYLEYEIKY